MHRLRGNIRFVQNTVKCQLSARWGRSFRVGCTSVNLCAPETSDMLQSVILWRHLVALARSSIMHSNIVCLGAYILVGAPEQYCSVPTLKCTHAACNSPPDHC